MKDFKEKVIDIIHQDIVLTDEVELRIADALLQLHLEGVREACEGIIGEDEKRVEELVEGSGVLIRNTDNEIRNQLRQEQRTRLKELNEKTNY